MERRRLFGRRFEDYVRKGVALELTPEEVSWRIIIDDPRYGSMLNRRKHVRRKAEMPVSRDINLHKSTVNLKSLEAIKKDDDGLY